MANKKDVKKFRCLNFGMCSKADAQEIIEIDAIETLSGTPECPHCHQQTLEEVAGKGTGTGWVKIAAGVGVVAVIAVACVFIFGNGPKKKRTMEPMAAKAPVEVVDDKADVKSDKVTDAAEETPKAEGLDETPAIDEPKKDAPEPAATPKKETTQPAQAKPSSPTTTTAKNGYGTMNLGYGVYTGDLKNGQPHGHGTIRYTKQHKIVSSKDFVANPGDTFEGDFREGRISSIGYWTHDGNQTAVKP